MLRWLLCPIALVVMTGWFGSTLAQPNVYQRIQKQLESVEQSNDPDAQQLEQAYQKTLRHLDKFEEVNAANSEYEQAIETYPQRSQQLRQELEEVLGQEVPDTTGWSLLRLQQALSESLSIQVQLTDQQSVLQQQVADFNERMRLFGERFSQLRARQKEVQVRLTQLNQQAILDDLSAAREVMYNQETKTLQAQLKNLELQQITSGSQQELFDLELELLRAKLAYQTRWQSQLQNQLDALRLRLTKPGEAVEESQEEVHPLVEMARIRVQQLEQRREETQRDTEQIRQQELDTRTEINRYSQLYINMQEQIAWLRTSRAYGQTLRRQIDELPSAPSLQPLEQAILAARVERLEFAQELEELAALREEEELPEADQPMMQSLVLQASQLLRELMSALDRLALEQVKLKVTTEQLAEQLQKLRELGSQQLFWIPDVAPLGPELLSYLYSDLQALISQQPLKQLMLALKEWGTWVLLTLGLMVLVLLYLGRSGKAAFLRYLNYTAARIGKVTQDKYRYTTTVLLLSLLLTLPMLVILSTAGLLLEESWRFPLVSSMGSALLHVIPQVILFMIFWNLARPRGLLIAHLDFDRVGTAKLVHYTRVLALLLIPLLLIQGFAASYREIAMERSIGRLALLLQHLVEIWFFVAIFRQTPLLRLMPGLYRISLVIRVLLIPLIVASTLAAAVGAGLGYFTVAFAVSEQIDNTLRLAFLLSLTYFLIHRFMLVQERRLAFEQAKARRAKILEKRAKEQAEEELHVSETLEGLEEPVIDLETIRSQSLGLLRALLLLLFLVLIPFIWSAGAFVFLETLVVWETVSVVGGVEQLEAVTLGDLLLGLFLMILILVVVKNLTGAMELLILQHLDLAPGTGFAITTLSRYLVIVIGVVYVAAFLGIDWSRAQWLVAALTVGLGFGLQEIFANFVSGLILLFEKPIRLGDTITIRNITGNVTRIQTRATTIVDWDRKEIIVPNKTFITEDFINWSLSDPINRWKGYVELPLETDTSMATEVLMDAARQCSRVLETPPPEVYFNAFQNGNQRYEIRVFLADISHRQPVAHELHSRLVKAFRDRGVDIAPPQMDIQMAGEVTQIRRPT